MTQLLVAQSLGLVRTNFLDNPAAQLTRTWLRYFVFTAQAFPAWSRLRKKHQPLENLFHVSSQKVQKLMSRPPTSVRPLGGESLRWSTQDLLAALLRFQRVLPLAPQESRSTVRSLGKAAQVPPSRPLFPPARSRDPRRQMFSSFHPHPNLQMQIPSPGWQR